MMRRIQQHVSKPPNQRPPFLLNNMLSETKKPRPLHSPICIDDRTTQLRKTLSLAPVQFAGDWRAALQKTRTAERTWITANIPGLAAHQCPPARSPLLRAEAAKAPSLLPGAGEAHIRLLKLGCANPPTRQRGIGGNGRRGKRHLQVSTDDRK